MGTGTLLLGVWVELDDVIEQRIRNLVTTNELDEESPIDCDIADLTV